MAAAQVHPNLRNLVDESGAYQLVRKIGSGPGGPVYVARGAAGDVAIRQFQSDEEVGSDLWRGDRERFLAAGHQQMTLTDPSIVPTLEIGRASCRERVEISGGP